jgi:hypothetical protein
VTLMKRKAFALLTILTLSFLIERGSQCSYFAEANPYPDKFVTEGDISPPEGTLAPTISIISPTNDVAYASNNVSLAFNVSIPEANNGTVWLAEVYYKTSWQSSETYVREGSNLASLHSETFSINLTNLSEGPRWIEIHAVGQGGHVTREVCRFPFSTIYQVFFKLPNSSMVNFTIDTIPPEISIPYMENKTYSAASIPLNFITNEPISHSTYSLDGQENVTIAGNTTLTELSKGDHNVTVYAKDEAGNVGASETMWFSVAEPFPIAPVAAASVAAVAVVGVSLMVYFKKRKH